MFGLGIKRRIRGGITALSEASYSHIFKPRLFPKGKERLDVVFSEPHDMPIGDRIMLYALIRGLKPERYLEIGVRWGGSARIVATAMQANGFGKVVGLDPDLSNFRPGKRELFGRVELVEGYSPDDTGRAVEALGGKPDLVFIDAVHTCSAVREDVKGVLPYIEDGAHILFHDAFHQGINRAVDEFLAENDGFTDLGIVSKNASIGTPVSYTGLRLVRKGGIDFEKELFAAHDREGEPHPEISSSVWDHDPYANRAGNPLGR